MPKTIPPNQTLPDPQPAAMAAPQVELSVETAAHQEPPHPAAAPVVQAAPMPSTVATDDRSPDWIQAWQQSATFERERAIVKLIGDSGECRRNKLTQELAQQFEIDADSGSIRRYIQRLVEMDVMALQPIKGIARGRATDLLLLTDKGRVACAHLFGAAPSPLYHRLLARHSSPEHLYLNLEAADLLKEAGYAVDLLPPAMTLADGSQFEPDLAAVIQGRTIYVECERDTRKNDQRWARKWHVMVAATNGVICIVTPNQAAMKTIGNDIRFLMSGRSCKLFMTNLDDVRSGKRSERAGIWLVSPSHL